MIAIVYALATFTYKKLNVKKVVWPSEGSINKETDKIIIKQNHEISDLGNLKAVEQKEILLGRVIKIIAVVIIDVAVKSEQDDFQAEAMVNKEHKVILATLVHDWDENNQKEIVICIHAKGCMFDDKAIISRV